MLKRHRSCERCLFAALLPHFSIYAKAPSAAAEGIDLNRPLAEITRDIVLRVYELEGQNQTKTSQHLDISRSTLWRMLK